MSDLYDAVVIGGGNDAVASLESDGRALEFVKDQFRHCKTILAFEGAERLLQAAGAPDGHGADQGVLCIDGKTDGIDDAFIAALAKHRHFARESDPPRV